MFETAGALVAFSSAANAGITIPAGDWTVDIGGNVNAFYTHTSGSANAGKPNTNTVQTGLLPSALGIGAKTRQNDLDVAFQFTFFVGADSGPGAGTPATTNLGSAGGGNTLNIRQGFMTVGDASWGQIKLGRDLGVYGSDAILSDMTLLGVGTAAGANGSSTLGRIGSGYMYADWIGQIQYSTPNWNGFQVTGSVNQPWTNGATGDTTNSNMGYQGKATYDFAVNDVTGRVWVSGISQKHDTGSETSAYTSRGWDIGAKASYQGASLVAYYYDGEGLSGNRGALNGLMYLQGNKSQDSGGYVQATFTVPGIGTKLGASWGESMSTADSVGATEYKSEAWIVGAYHPLTKSVNLVAEYTNTERTGAASVTDTAKTTAKTVSLGAIMFF